MLGSYLLHVPNASEMSLGWPGKFQILFEFPPIVSGIWILSELIELIELIDLSELNRW